MEHAVVYARYSSHSQTEQSIEGQLSAAYNYAHTKGYNIIKEYIDRAQSGTTDNREQFQKMLSDCKKKRFTVIIVWKVDRFGRNREEITINKYKAKKCGVRVEYVAENITSGPEGVILESVLEGMAEYYSLQLSQNVSRGYLESAKKHHVIGIPPLGYKKAPDKTYEIVEDQAKVVRLIFDKYNSGMSQREIIDYLNGNGFRTNRGSAFSKSVLQRILNDERYIGTYTYKDIIKEENIIHPIVDRETFYASRTPKATWSYDTYKLSSILYCKCGSKMKGSSGYGKGGTKYNYYICPKCKKTHIRTEKLDVAVETKVREILSDSNIIDDIAARLYEYYLEHSSDKTEEEMLIANITKVDEKCENLLKSIENGLNPDIIVPRIKRLEEEKQQLYVKLSQIRIERPFEITLDAVKYFLQSVSPDKFVNKIVADNRSAVIALNCIDAELEVDCSTMIREMAQSDHESNIIVYQTLALVKCFF